MTDFFSAKHHALKAQKWATGTMAECPDGSAKHWAEVAEATAGLIGDPANRDLSNLTDVGLSRLSNLPLFISFKTGHIMNNASYVNGRYFSWLSGKIYTSAYQELVKEMTGSTTGQIKIQKLYAWASGNYVIYTETLTPTSDSDLRNADGTNYVFNGTYPKYVVVSGIVDGYLSAKNEGLGEGLGLARSQAMDKTISELIAEQKTQTINGVTITYYLTDTKKKICLPDQQDAIIELYNATGAADFYLLDTENVQFKLPRRHARRLLRTYKNGANWYNLYSDGWLEQGGQRTDMQTVSLDFHIPFANTDYTFNATIMRLTGAVANFSICYDEKTASSILVQLRNQGAGVGGTYMWEASGYADTSLFTDEFEYEYYFVGNTVQNQTSVDVGALSETLNNKADVDLANANPAPAFKSQSAGWGMPDYSSQVTKSTPFTTEFDCYVHCLIGTTAAFGITQLLADGIVVDKDVNQTSNTNNVITSLKGFIPKGCTVTVVGGNSTTATCFVTPLKGANNV